MKFGDVPLDKAKGAVLAHTLRLPGAVYKKGTVLSDSDLSSLAENGIASVVAARLEPDDVTEDEAARRVADSLLGPNVRAAKAATGRVNLYAEADGLFLTTPEQIHAVNQVDESITIATLSPYTRVHSGDMVATIKIIPFGVDAPTLTRFHALIERHEQTLQVLPFTPKRVALVVTRLPGEREKVVSKRRTAVVERVEDLGGSVEVISECAHNNSALLMEVAKLGHGDHDLLLLFGASAIVDRFDVIPSSLVGAGGEIVRLGMPVDPGNLLLLGQLGRTPVVGVPSCAASPKMNGFDWVLERIFAGIPPSGIEITKMGLGGLLKENPSRPQPRESRVTKKDDSRSIAAVVLAAGQSTRMGQSFKLLEQVGGLPMIRRVCENVMKSRVSHISVVIGHRGQEVTQALAGLPVSPVSNPEYRNGLSTSLSAGIRALPPGTDGALIVLGDMPNVDARLIDQLIDAFEPNQGSSICVPAFRGRAGNPVLWGASYFWELQAVKGDNGAKHLIGEYANAVEMVEVDNASIFLDADTPEELARIRDTHPSR